MNIKPQNAMHLTVTRSKSNKDQIDIGCANTVSAQVGRKGIWHKPGTGPRKIEVRFYDDFHGVGSNKNLCPVIIEEKNDIELFTTNDDRSTIH